MSEQITGFRSFLRLVIEKENDIDKAGYFAEVLFGAFLLLFSPVTIPFCGVLLLAERAWWTACYITPFSRKALYSVLFYLTLPLFAFSHFFNIIMTGNWAHRARQLQWNWDVHLNKGPKDE